ncbi:MAG: vitamin B12-dependent ribonucleotide reductase, partial [Acidimicrobiales bacterium]
LPSEARLEVGVLGTAERLQPTLPGIEEATVVTAQGLDVDPDPPSSVHVEGDTVVVETPSADVPKAAFDAPLCMTCGVQMSRAGSCFVCHECGSTSGCS